MENYFKIGGHTMDGQQTNLDLIHDRRKTPSIDKS